MRERASGVFVVRARGTVRRCGVSAEIDQVNAIKPARAQDGAYRYPKSSSFAMCLPWLETAF